jgi:protein SCO1/2
MFKRLFLLPALAAALLSACSGQGTDTVVHLPYIGERDVRPRADGGPADTVFATIPPFRVTDQARQVITNKSLAGRAYVASFFFATCPGICPKMHGQLLKVYQPFAKDPRVAFISYTIDPAHDTIPVLLDYAHRLGVSDPNRWHFVTTGFRGEPAARDTVIELAHSYFTAAVPDQAAPGGIAHNGTLALVDDQGHIRGLYDSLNEKEVARLMAELPLLLAEIDSRQPKQVASK